jgi:hypothetical protein
MVAFFSQLEPNRQHGSFFASLLKPRKHGQSRRAITLKVNARNPAIRVRVFLEQKAMDRR